MKQQEPPRDARMSDPIVRRKPILATDLDGTLIPPSTALEDSWERQSLRAIAARSEDDDIEMVFVTGRHFESVNKVMRSEGLPTPNWIICDVGTSLFKRTEDRYDQVHDYSVHVEQQASGTNAQSVAPLLLTALQDKCQLRLQEPEKQQCFKLSFYCDAASMVRDVMKMEEILRDAELPFDVISSIDPIDGRGLVDILPRGINKAAALRWWADWQELDPREIVYAGDSDNDFAAMTAMFRTIVVGNAPRDLVRRLRLHHSNADSLERFFVATQPTAAGVLEGCIHYGLIKEPSFLETPTDQGVDETV
jgi:HAD superfamily hydrolase (TIGR01484 family)